MRESRAGGIFDGRSPAGQHALAQLRAAFQRAGFYAEKERWTESSLRVYPERRGRYPLLNPSLAASRSRSAIPLEVPSILCPVYSDHDDAITRLLARLPAIAGCRFISSPPRPRHTRYELHGTFILPIVFVEQGQRRIVDFNAFVPPLETLHLHLTGGLFLGSAFGARPIELHSR